jgi:hypothetical protein
MKFKAFVYLFLILVGFSVKAETQYILMDGGSSPTSNYYRFYNAMRRGYETARSIGKAPKVIAKDGTWKVAQQHPDEKPESYSLTPTGQQSQIVDNKPTYPPISQPARNTADIESLIKSSTKDGDAVLLYITPHGNPPTDPTKPETATLGLWGKEMSYVELRDTLAKFPNIKFKITTTACYAGGIHYISRSLKNSCSSSIVPYFNPSSAGYFSEYPFDISFWDHIKKTNGQTSFAEANLAGYASQNEANPLQASLSSFDYVDFILKKGQHQRVFPQGNRSWLRPKWFQVQNPVGYKSTFEENLILSPSTSIPASLNSGICASCCSGGVQSDLDKLSKLSATLNEIVQESVANDLERKADQQPSGVRTVFHKVIDDMKKNGSKYLQISKEYVEKYQALTLKWNNLNGKNKDWKNEGNERATIQKEFDDLKASAERDLKQYSFNHQMLERLQRLDEFNKKATPEQKEKFVQLLKCEWEPI